MSEAEKKDDNYSFTQVFLEAFAVGRANVGKEVPAGFVEEFEKIVAEHRRTWLKRWEEKEKIKEKFQ